MDRDLIGGAGRREARGQGGDRRCGSRFGVGWAESKPAPFYRTKGCGTQRPV